MAPLASADPSPSSVTVLLEPLDRTTLDAERQGLLATTLPDAISTPEEYEDIAHLQARVSAFIKRVRPEFDGVCDAAHKAWKKATGLRALFFDGLEAFDARARGLMGDYKAQEDRRRREEERRLAEAAMAEERARQQREAKLLEKQGQKDMAAALRATPVTAPTVSLPSAVPDVQGLTYATMWKWRIAGTTDPHGGRKDKDARKRAALLVPRELCDLDDAAITSRVTSMKSLARIPGIEVYSEQVPVRRG